jgi:hypothetical protein
VATKGGIILGSQGLSSSTYKMLCTQTILQLYMGDVVAAEKTYMEVNCLKDNWCNID